MDFQWPDGASGALSITFDDGMASHLSDAAPILEAHGVRATFYLVAKGDSDYSRRLEQFAPLAERGHEIGQHSVHHYCSCSRRMNPNETGLEYMTLADMEAELDETRRRFGRVFPESDRWSFAYTCYDTEVGMGVERTSYVPLVAERYAAARGGNRRAFNSPYHTDLACTNALQCEFMQAAQLLGIASQTIAQGSWSVLIFHGLNEGHLPVATPEFQGFIDGLSQFAGRLWVAPFLDVAMHIDAYRQAARA
jgi:peptidoglycan/xylan/chitin deacetylase (PgdA/CDA1 family)